MSSLPIDALKATALAAASSHPEVDAIVLFGSSARGQARPDSDADIGILGGGFWQILLAGRCQCAWMALQSRRSCPSVNTSDFSPRPVVPFVIDS